MTALMMSVMLGVIMLRAARRDCDAYAAFLRGAEQGMRSAFSLLPALCGMLLMMGCLRACGATDTLARLLSPLLVRLGMPEEIVPLLLLRPLTGSGSLAALEEILVLRGPDSRAGRMAAALVGSSETIFYTMSVYAGAAGVRKVPGALMASLCGYAAGAVVCFLMVR